MKLSKLPFYYKSHDKADNGGLPHVLPFELFYDEELGMFRQKASDNLRDVLEVVYQEGSLVDGSVSSESGKHYIQKLLKYILDTEQINRSSKILEVGFGTGDFLKELSEVGYRFLYGIEPGNHKLVSGLEDINLYCDFYPSALFNDKVDVIFHSLVLEHIEDPIAFLESQSRQLNEDGRIIFFVPNEEPFLKKGDCSSFIHEHFNFFTKDAIVNLVKKLTLNLEDISVIDGLLAVTLCKREKSIYHSNENYFLLDEKEYFVKLENTLNRIQKFLNDMGSPEQTALYVPGRALNSMCMLNVSNVRLVDDNSEITGKFLPFFQNPVESFNSILESPPKAILIFSRTFGHLIKQKCFSQEKLKDCKVLVIDDL
ncbi:class I SAM-dependent methyltransferase [uncultured Roseivirga sp.]|uniref:class I SAM-dependent methyltransferase n=1 Tax=uncultured Roseivirga sp. TaxID=543088 RepID=UPI0030DC4EED